MQYPDKETFVVLFVVLGSSYAYVRYVDKDPETANKLFVRLFATMAVVTALYIAYASVVQPDEPFPFDTDGKVVDSFLEGPGGEGPV